MARDNAPPLDGWQIPVVHCCGLALDPADLTCPSCGGWLNPAIKHIDSVLSD